MFSEKRGYEPPKEKGTELRVGQEIKVIRHKGRPNEVIEHDWEVTNVDKRGGTISAAKTERDGRVSIARLNREDFFKANPELGDPRPPRPKSREMQKKLVLREGQRVSIERSDGRIEDDWEVVSKDSETGKIIVHKVEGGEVLEKKVSLAELKKFNPDI